ncbi:hypothetical protein N7463_001800 [Penicillium fimorum]|uniref:Uncharacterized protein n=1 Tax=Penicillium fimorum TaxID=1882269 RepID=A0A9W9XY57_9EURO|nr:hypothetical protein N7463_001800 [Penicillium fimorum]
MAITEADRLFGKMILLKGPHASPIGQALQVFESLIGQHCRSSLLSREASIYLEGGLSHEGYYAASFDINLAHKKGLTIPFCYVALIDADKVHPEDSRG